MNFKSSLENGKQMEKLVDEYLIKHTDVFVSLISIEQPTNKFSDYDIKYSLTIEVKNDKYPSNNFAFEYYNPKSQCVSGVYVSKADYIVYVTTFKTNDMRKVIFFDREELKKELIECKELDKTITGFRDVKDGGDKNANLYLYDKQYVLDNFKSIKHIDNI